MQDQFKENTNTEKDSVHSKAMFESEEKTPQNKKLKQPHEVYLESGVCYPGIVIL